MKETERYTLFRNCPKPDIAFGELKYVIDKMILSVYHNLPRMRYYWDQQSDMELEFIKIACEIG